MSASISASPVSPWSNRQGLLILASFALLYAAASAAHMLLVKYTVGFDAYVGHGPTLPAHMLLVLQLTKAALLLGVLAIALRRRGLDWSAVGLRRTTWRWIAIAVLVAIASLWLRLWLARWMVVQVPAWASFMRSPYAPATLHPAMTLALGLCTIVVTPFAEEVFFRGFLFTWMATHRPFWLAIAASSVMFGAVHILPPQAISAALGAVALCAMYWLSRSVWPAIVCHAVGNAIGFIAMVVPAGQGLG